MLTIYLCKAVIHLRVLKIPDAEITEDARSRAYGPHPISLNWGQEFADRFTVAEIKTLWSRFKQLDADLQADHELFEPAFQSSPMYYYFNELPASVETESFIASWPTDE